MKLDISEIDFTKKRLRQKYDPSFTTRYVLVATLVDKIRQKLALPGPLQILDIGGYNGAARDLLTQDKVTILDVKEDRLLDNYIQVTRVGVPREDASFDIVISTDTLEHIKPQERVTFIEEAIRVAKHAVIIAAPFENEGEVGIEEAIANATYRGETGVDYIWLGEHISYGIPSRKWLDNLLSNKGLNFTRFSHTSLRLWGELLSIGYFIANNIEEVDKGIARGLVKLNRKYFNEIAQQDFPENGYRTVYVIVKNKEKIDIITPPFNPEVVANFIYSIRMALGRAVALISQRYNEVQTNRDELVREVARLEDIEKAYISVTNSRGFRAIKNINKAFGR